MVAFVGLVINCGIVIHALRKQSIAMKRLCGCFNAIRNTVEREEKVIKGKYNHNCSFHRLFCSLLYLSAPAVFVRHMLDQIF